MSVISSVYDPLGITAPFILLAKLILQDLCRRQLQSDDPIPENSLTKWEKRLTDLPKLSNVTLTRCLKPLDFGEVATYELHHLDDASQYAYGAVFYLRIVNVNGQIHCSLSRLSSSRVSFLRQRKGQNQSYQLHFCKPFETIIQTTIRKLKAS